MIAYKVFDENWKCRNFQFKMGKEYFQDGKLVLCKNGFHFCRKLVNCFNYSSFDPNNKIAEIEVLGDFIGDPEDKECSNNIKLIKELSWNEVLNLVNTGVGNSGYGNSGNRNSGYGNSGDGNSGDGNSGDGNSGNRNSGDGNLGDGNSGDGNSGNRNSGNRNSGDGNSGDGNSGDGNSGDGNSGYGNSGNRNSGNRNSGNRNSGDGNSGYGNSCDYESGNFNSITSDEIRVFNKICRRTDWDNSKKPSFISNVILNQWIYESEMSDQEKIDNPKFHITNGYLKTFTYKEAWANAYKDATKRDIELLKNLPNFDANVFEEITGIKVD